MDHQNPAAAADAMAAAPAELGPYGRFYEHDLFGGGYTDVYRGLRATPDPTLADDVVPAPSDVLRLVAKSLDVRLVFMMLVQDGRTETFH